ncbi:uncharacterized protein LOC135165636 [Diachasmimorpha longicaudata]|uniref:uncharacterized protein LOC135165636 n=1 Tax=Diachasmimorpha longicaudata TaxID=58733 RepID=UPI0030B912B8
MGRKGIQLVLGLAVCIAVAYGQLNEKIINGQNAWPGLFPHQVSLQQRKSHFCGGSIIDATHILTAAHCVVDDLSQVLRPDDIKVVTGVVDHLARRPSNTFSVAAIIPHESYNSRALNNDIAILKLNRPIPFNSLQRPIGLPTRDTPSGTRVTASGWGATWTNSAGLPGPCPRFLQQLPMIALNLDECKNLNDGRIYPGQICAVRPAETGICFGDSGGPLIHKNQIIGISSYVKGGCASPNADFFTRVFTYLPWINNVLASYVLFFVLSFLFLLLRQKINIVNTSTIRSYFGHNAMTSHHSSPSLYTFLRKILVRSCQIHSMVRKMTFYLHNFYKSGPEFETAEDEKISRSRMETRKIQSMMLYLAVSILGGHGKPPSRIIKGQDSSLGECPYQVQLRKDDQHWCGGSILDATHIITAAHCLSNTHTVTRAEELQVLAGVVDSRDPKDDDLYDVSEIIIHQDWNPKLSRNVAHFGDIAVLKLARPIRFNPYRRPIRLPSRNPPVGTPVIASGWGATHHDVENYSGPSWLQKLTMKIVSLEDCKKAHPQQIDDGHICALGPPGSAVCFGDSGGPLVHKNELIGVVSWGAGQLNCAYISPDDNELIYIIHDESLVTSESQSMGVGSTLGQEPCGPCDSDTKLIDLSRNFKYSLYFNDRRENFLFAHTTCAHLSPTLTCHPLFPKCQLINSKDKQNNCFAITCAVHQMTNCHLLGSDNVLQAEVSFDRMYGCKMEASLSLILKTVSRIGDDDGIQENSVGNAVIGYVSFRCHPESIQQEVCPATRTLTKINRSNFMYIGFAKPASKIVDGHDAFVAEFPHQVSLQLGGQHFCGGSIIDATHVLTAAHCVLADDGTVIRGIEVVTGVLDYHNRNANNVFTVSRAIPHPKYAPKDTWRNDIAVLKLTKRIIFNANQKPIRLPTRDTPGGARVMTSGWGADIYLGDKSQSVRYLQKLAMEVISLQQCRRVLGSGIQSGQICAVGSRGTGICVGDSGGPLTYNNAVIGVASFVIPCAKGYPDVYTRVYRYVPWINQVRRTS